MIIIGVTGNSGAGKSTVSTIIKNNTGALVIDADQIARMLMVPGQDYFNEVVNLFGEEIIITRENAKRKGKIDNSVLAKMVFSDDEKREKLNKLTFKYVGKKAKEIILKNQDRKFIVLDFPLLYEGGFDKICNCVIGVFADEKAKINRLKERDKIKEEDILARINTQMPEEKLKEAVDFVVNNSSSIRYLALVKDVVKLVHKIEKDEEEKKNS